MSAHPGRWRIQALGSLKFILWRGGNGRGRGYSFKKKESKRGFQRCWSPYLPPPRLHADGARASEGRGAKSPSFQVSAPLTRAGGRSPRPFSSVSRGRVT